ncbi:MAG TPA: hypothetical protein VNG53_05690 [Bacteroidia bacterium]|nr:hypothetical protein [Bacteroidia bacterium]
MKIDKHTKLLTFAEKDGQIVHISEVENGLDCKCKCLSCGAILIAKNNSSEKKEKHFAHWKAEECLHAFETAIHKVAKKIIKDKRQIIIPAIYNKYGDLLSKQELILLDDVKSEDEEITSIGKYSDGSLIRPDLIGIKQNRQLVIEIYVTHKTDSYKVAKIKKHKISAIEINLENVSLDTNTKEIEEAILNPHFTTWLYNDKKEALQNKKLQELRSSGFALVAVDRELYAESYFDDACDCWVMGAHSDKIEIKCPNYQNELSNFIKSLPLKNEIVQSIVKGSVWNKKIYRNTFYEGIIYLNGSPSKVKEDDIKALDEYERISRPNKWITECQECPFHKGVFADFVKCGKDLTSKIQ